MVKFRVPISKVEREITSHEIYANDLTAGGKSVLHNCTAGAGSLSPSSEEEEEMEEERHLACAGPEAGDADTLFSKDPVTACTVRENDPCVLSLFQLVNGGGGGRGRCGEREEGKRGTWMEEVREGGRRCLELVSSECVISNVYEVF